MEILQTEMKNLAKCDCGTVVRYNKYDLQWSHTEENCYYLICPVCKKIIWLDKTPEMDKMYNEAWLERHPKDR